MIRELSVLYLLFGEVFLRLLLLHSKLVVHLLSTLTNVFAFTEVINVGQTLPWLPLRLGQDVFDFWIVLGKTKLKVNHTVRNIVTNIKQKANKKYGIPSPQGALNRRNTHSGGPS